MRSKKMKMTAALAAAVVCFAGCSEAKVEESESETTITAAETTVETTAASEETTETTAASEETTETTAEPTWEAPSERLDVMPVVQVNEADNRCSISVDDQYAALNESLAGINSVLGQDSIFRSDIFVSRCDNKVLSYNYRLEDLNVFYAGNFDVDGSELTLDDVITSRQDLYDVAFEFIEDNYGSYFRDWTSEQLSETVLDVAEDKWYMDVNSLDLIIGYHLTNVEGELIDKSYIVRIPYTLIEDIMNPAYMVDSSSPIIGEYSFGEFRVDDSLTIESTHRCFDARRFDIVDIMINDNLIDLNEAGWSSTGDCRYVRDVEGNDYFVIYRSNEAPDSAESVFKIEVYSVDPDGLALVATVNTDDLPSMVNSFAEFNSYDD